MSLMWATRLPLARLHYGHCTSVLTGRYCYTLAVLASGRRMAGEWLGNN